MTAPRIGDRINLTNGDVAIPVGVVDSDGNQVDTFGGEAVRQRQFYLFTTSGSSQALANANISGLNGSGTPAYVYVSPGAGVTWRVLRVGLYIAAQSGSPSPYTFGTATALNPGLKLQTATAAAPESGTNLLIELTSHLGIGSKCSHVEQGVSLDWRYTFDLNLELTGTNRLQFRLDEDLSSRPAGAYNVYGYACVEVLS